MPPRRRPSSSPIRTVPSPPHPEEKAETKQPEPEPEPEPGREPEPGHAGEEAPAYVPAATFGGARAGYEFKRGTQGLGYYYASQPSAAETAETTSDGAEKGSGWTDAGERFSLESVPALSAEKIQEMESQEELRVAELSRLARSSSDSELVRAIFELCDEDADGRLSMTEYGAFLKKIAYSKPWTDAQWAKECDLIGADADRGVGLEEMETLYAKYRQAKLRVDFGNVHKLPGEVVRQLMEEARRAHGSLGGKNAAARVAGDSQALTGSDMADSKLSPEECVGPLLHTYCGGDNTLFKRHGEKTAKITSEKRVKCVENDLWTAQVQGDAGDAGWFDSQGHEGAGEATWRDADPCQGQFRPEFNAVSPTVL